MGQLAYLEKKKLYFSKKPSWQINMASLKIRYSFCHIFPHIGSKDKFARAFTKNSITYTLTFFIFCALIFTLALAG